MVGSERSLTAMVTGGLPEASSDRPFCTRCTQGLPSNLIPIPTVIKAWQGLLLHPVCCAV